MNSAGDILLFWNAATNPVSEAIEVLTGRKGKKGPSHAAIFTQPLLRFPPITGSLSGLEPAKVFECTLVKGCNGCRIIAPPDLLAEYGKGSRIGVYALMPWARAQVDWGAFDAAIGEMVGAIKYSVPDLLKFLLPESVEFGDPDTAAKMVCSQAVARILVKSCKAFQAVQYERISPADIETWAGPDRIGGPLLMPGVPIL